MSWVTEHAPKEVVKEVKEMIEKNKEKVAFAFKEVTCEGREIFLIFGEKGQGKSTLALSFPGTLAALSFDGKTAIVKKNFYNSNERMHVYDAVEFLNEDKEFYTASANQTYKYILFLLEEIKRVIRPDYVIIDGSELLNKILEQSMRFNHGLGPFQNFANLNLWKDRTLQIRAIHRAALNAATKGVIYTTYCEQLEEIKEGAITTKKTIPKHIDVILQDADYVIRVDDDYDKVQGKKFFAKVVSSKVDSRLKSGVVIDVTNKGLFAASGVKI